MAKSGIRSCYDLRMTTISVSVASDAYQLLEAIAESQKASPELLVEQYLEYLVAGGAPLPVEDDVPIAGIMRLAEKSSSFAWLKDEPDLYTFEDGEPYG